MNDLGLIVALYRALAEYARITPIEGSWGTKRLVVHTKVSTHNGYHFSAIVVKDIELITMIPQLKTGSYDDVNSVIMAYRNNPTAKVVEIEDAVLNNLFSNQLNIDTKNNSLMQLSNKNPLEILTLAIDNAFAEYLKAMNTFTYQYRGNNIYSLSLLLPSWSYSSPSMYKPFGSNLFTSSSGIDIIHKAIEVNQQGTGFDYISDTQLSGEVVRCVKHDNIV